MDLAIQVTLGFTVANYIMLFYLVLRNWKMDNRFDDVGNAIKRINHEIQVMRTR